MSHLKKVAIIGSGFSGLAASWYLLNLPNPPEVTVYTKNEEASQISAGLLHKYMGLYAKLNPIAEESLDETLTLLAIAENYAPSPIILSRGLVRLAMIEKQRIAYAHTSNQYSDVKWLDNCQKLDPNAAAVPGIFISSGLTIDAKAYLEGLQLACKHKGLQLQFKEIKNMDELSGYDHVINAMGSESASLEPFLEAKIHRLKGQLLEIEWPKELPCLPYTLVSQIYIAHTQDKSKAVIGATYEHEFTDSYPEWQRAVDYLFPKALELYPKLGAAKVVAVKAGMRATTPSRLPIIQRIHERYSLIAGLGSRGLLYHAYFAKKIIKLITK